jgi:hypothetical protein
VEEGSIRDVAECDAELWRGGSNELAHIQRHFMTCDLLPRDNYVYRGVQKLCATVPRGDCFKFSMIWSTYGRVVS